ncbi:MAG: acyl-CoA dehydrogenase family protein [Thermoanaerobaculia bacterium]
MDFALSPLAESLLTRLRDFLDREVHPHEEEILATRARHCPGPHWRTWQDSPLVAKLQAKARAAGLWNLFLADSQLGAGLQNLDYAPLAEAMGWSVLAPEIFNCNAPDSGNMEVLLHHGTTQQQERWLQPLLAGTIRSTFCMSEPDVASSDPTNLAATVEIEGEDLVLSGRKWWATGVGHPRCEVGLFVGVSNPQADRHRRHSLALVPLDAPGVRIVRMLPCFGEFDPPSGHGEIEFDRVRVPRANLIGEPGQGFAIAQGRLGPGRVHHCMRAIGAAERALSLMVRRSRERSAFGRQLVDLGGNRERIGDLRIAIDGARLQVLHAAWKLDQAGSRGARQEISAIKVVVPAVLQRVADEAIQLFGGAGLTGDLPLTACFAMARALRIADGPDAVHRDLVARLELRKYDPPATKRPQG